MQLSKKGMKKMINFKQKIAEMIANTIEANKEELETYIEKPKTIANGDYAFPCFKLAKTLKKAPQAIAEAIKEKMETFNYG